MGLGDPRGVGFALRKNAASKSLAAPIIKIKQTNNAFLVDVEVHFPREPKTKVFCYHIREYVKPNLSTLPLYLSYPGGISFLTSSSRFLIICKNSISIWRRITEVLIMVKCNKYKTSIEKKTIHLIPCTRGWQECHELFSSRAS